jgi:hypothetical protein
MAGALFHQVGDGAINIADGVSGPAAFFDEFFAVTDIY